MIFAAPFRRKTHLTRLCAIACVAAIAALSACTPPKPAPLPAVVLPPPPVAANPLARDQSNYLRLPNMAPGVTPVRVGIILPFSNGTAATTYRTFP